MPIITLKIPRMIPVAPQHRKYLKFYWEIKRYWFCCLQSGVSSKQRALSALRDLGHELNAYQSANQGS